MAEEEVVVRMSAKDEGIVRAWQAGRNSIAAYNAQLGKLDDTQRANAKAAAEFDRANAQAMKNAKAVLESLMTPQQRYQQSLEKLSSLHSRGLITVEQYLAAMAKEKAALDAGDPAIQRAIERKKQLETAGRQLTDSTRTAGERYRAEVSRLNELLNAGTISEETHTRAVRKAREELLRVSGHVSKRQQAEEELSQQLEESARLEAQRGAAARRVLTEIATPQQRYNEKLRELTALRQQNLLTERQYERAVRSARHEFEESGKKQSSLFDGIGSKIGVAAAGYLSVSAAVGGIRTALTAVMESNQRFIQQAEEAGAKYDKIFRQYRIQAGLGKLEGEQAQKSILQQAEIAGFTEERAGAAATALVSAGVAPDQASGGALEGFLATLNAQGLRDADPSQYADAMTAVLQSNGMEVNAENMTKLGTQLQSAPIKETKLKLTSLPQLASVSAGLSGAMTQQEQLATFAVGGSAMGSFDKMATSMADITKNLRVAASKPDAVEYLAKIGLKPKQVDFVGEDFGTVMKTLKDALDKAPEELRTQVLAKVIEGGNVSAFNVIQNNMGKILETASAMDGADAQALYRNDVAIGSSGIDAAQTRQQLRRNRVLAERDTQGTLQKNELVQQSLASGEAPILQDIRGSLFDTSRYLYRDDATAAAVAEVGGTAVGDPNLLMRGVQLAGNIATNNATGLLSNLSGDAAALGRVSTRAAGNVESASEGVNQRLGSSIEYQNKLMEQQLELQRKQLELQKRPAANDIRPNLTPAGPVPSAANDARRP